MRKHEDLDESEHALDGWPEAERVARGLALEAHSDQRDRAGRRYGLHLATVAGLVRPGRQRTAAWLHDILENTTITAHDLRAIGFDTQTVQLVETLTRRSGEPYKAYIDRVAQGGADTIAVKMADLEDHLQTGWSLPGSLRERYERACQTLGTEQSGEANTALTPITLRTCHRRGRHEYKNGIGGSYLSRATRAAEALRIGNTPDEAAWELTQVASWALDHGEHSDERRYDNEGIYTSMSRTLPGGRKPKRGDVYATLPGLRVEVRIDDAWPLPARTRRGTPYEIWGLKLRIVAEGPEGIAAPRNYNWGFYGSWTESEAPSKWDIDAAEAWEAVLTAHATAGRGTSEDHELRSRLDSRWGPKYADTLAEHLNQTQGDIKAAVRAAGAPRDRDQEEGTAREASTGL